MNTKHVLRWFAAPLAALGLAAALPLRTVGVGGDRLAAGGPSTGGPILVLPARVTAEATGPDGAAVSWIAAATTPDGGGPSVPAPVADPDGTSAPGRSVPVVCDPPAGWHFPLARPTTVTCTATDATGGTATGSFTVTVGDTTAPAFEPVLAVVVPAESPEGAVVNYDPAPAADLVEGPVTPHCAPTPGARFPIGDTVVTCTAADTAGNAADTSFTVTVTDTDPPRLRIPPDQVVEATGPDGAAAAWTATASDNAGGEVDVVCDAEPSVFTLGSTTVTCRAVDGAGNLSVGSFVVEVVDTTAPTVTFTGPAGPLEATGPDGARARYEATATDLVGGEVPVFCTPEPGTPIPFGSTAVHCAAADSHGNVALGPPAQLVVADTTGPVIEVPADIVREATGPGGTRVSFAASATDLVDGPVAVTCGPASGLVFPPGETTVNCNADDTAGNPAQPRRFSVTVGDTIAPVVLVPEEVTSPPTGVEGAAVGFTAVAIDTVEGETAPTCDHPAGSVFAIGVTRVTCWAVDAAGNRAEAGFEVFVTGLTPQGFQAPVDGGNVVNAVPAGATVPLLFEMFAGQRELTSTAAVEALVVRPVACDTLEPLPETGPLLPGPEPATAPELAAAGPLVPGTVAAEPSGATAYDPAGLSYDITTGMFVGLWTTPHEPGRCHQVTLTAVGGESLVAVFELT